MSDMLAVTTMAHDAVYADEWKANREKVDLPFVNMGNTSMSLMWRQALRIDHTKQLAADMDARQIGKKLPWHHFLHKVFALEMAADEWPGRDIVWIDGDVTVHEEFGEKWINSLIGDAHVAALLRDDVPNCDTETGFVIYRREGVQMIRAMAAYYTSGVFRTQPDWGDGHAFDVVLNWLPHLTIKDLSEGVGPPKHVWPRTRLAEKMTHHKGPRRKRKAYS